MASEYDIVQAAASIYADSLLELAEERQQAEAVLGELEQLVDLWNRDPPFATLMCSAAIDDNARRESLKRIFSGKLIPLVYNMLLVLNDRHRTMILPRLARAYRHKLNLRLNRYDVLVTSAVPLMPEQRQRLTAAVRRRLNRDVILREAVDPAVIGGLRVQVEDYVYDATTAQRLRQIRVALLRSAEQQILSSMPRFIAKEG